MDEQTKQPAVLPVPTPNPGAKTGSGLPTAVSYNVPEKQWTDTPSWDYQRFGETPQAAATNPTAISNLNYNINKATSVSPTTTVTPSGSSGGLTADVLRSKFGINDNNVITNILNNPNEKARYEREMNPTPSGGGDSGINNEQKAIAKYKEITGDNPSDDLLKKWEEMGGDLEARADEGARLDMENAQREYDAVMSALSGQREYIKGSAQTQRERALKREGDLKAEADVQSEKDQARIAQEKQAYEASYEGDKSTLAQNWKDISRYTQALQRASGRQDSSFGNFAESKQLMDFNKGLRVLATKNTEALTEFNNTVSDTLDFYRNEKKNIERTTSDEISKVDDWENAQITAIRGQEGISLAKKFSDINNARKTAENLKTQIESNISDKVAALDTWLVQTKINMQNQVAMLAKTNASRASVNDVAKMIKDGIDTGMLNYRKIVPEGPQPGTNISTGPIGQIFGKLPNGQDFAQEVPLETVDQYYQDRQNKIDLVNRYLPKLKNSVEGW